MYNDEIAALSSLLLGVRFHAGQLLVTMITTQVISEGSKRRFFSSCFRV